jgi:hypothetical protein
MRKTGQVTINSKSADRKVMGVRPPPPGTNKTKSLSHEWPLLSEWPFSSGSCFDDCWFFAIMPRIPMAVEWLFEPSARRRTACAPATDGCNEQTW